MLSSWTGTRLPCCLPPTRNGAGILIYGLFAAQSPAHRLQETPYDVPCKTRGQDSLLPFLWGSCIPTICRFSPALSGIENVPGLH
jgi:hypothetical protein